MTEREAIGSILTSLLMIFGWGFALAYSLQMKKPKLYVAVFVAPFIAGIIWGFTG